MTTKIDFLISTNEDWLDALVLKDGENNPIDLTGSTFRAHIRREPDALTVVLNATSANGLLVILESAAAWNVPFATIVEKLNPGTYAYDFLWTDADGVVTRIAEGTLTVELGITR